MTPCYPPHLTPMDRGSAPGSTPCGTVSYAAPEVMRSVVNHRRLMAPWAELPKLDIFSAGAGRVRRWGRAQRCEVGQGSAGGQSSGG